jgi:hypothetical protein
MAAKSPTARNARMRGGEPLPEKRLSEFPLLVAEVLAEVLVLLGVNDELPIDVGEAGEVDEAVT